MTEEADHEGDDQATSSLMASVFDSLQPSTPNQRPSVLKRMGRDSTPRPSVFQRLRGGKSPKPFVFTRIKTGGKSSSSSLAQDENFVFTRLSEVKEVQSFIPSCTTLDVKTDGSLKVERHTLVITNCKASSTSKGKSQGDGQASFHPITICEAVHLEDDSESTEALEIPENLGDFQHGLASGNFLNRHFP